MRISEFLSTTGVKLGIALTDQNQAIDELIALHQSVGNLNDPAAFKEAILAREAKGSTAIGMGIAVPHGKSAAVKKAGLVAITCPAGVDYHSMDGMPTNLLFMIAAPEGAADTHLEVLSKLMTMLMDQSFCQKLVKASTADEFLSIIDQKEAEKDAENEAKNTASQKKAFTFLGVTACPTGIAHTYMAAEGLEKAAAESGISIKVETDGSGGVKNALTSAEIAEADCIILACDRNVEMARFDGKKVLNASTANAIHNPQELIRKAMSGNVPVYHHTGGNTMKEDTNTSVGHTIYKHLMSGVSHMLPFVIGGGILVALAFLVDTICGYGATGGGNFGSCTPLAAFLKNVGGTIMGLMVPVLAGYIAYSIADRPGLAVGFAGGLLAANGNALVTSFTVWGGSVDENGAWSGLSQSLGGFSKFVANFGFANPNSGNTVSGFLGGIAAGFLAGYVVLMLQKLCSGMPKSMDGVKPMLIYPVVGIFIVGVVMCFILNPLIGLVNTGLSAMLTALSAAGMLALMGLILGAMMAIDMGGPINKAAYVFGTGALAQAAAMVANDTPNSDPAVQACYIAMASIMAGGMVPPLGIALACKFFPKKFTEAERSTVVTNVVMACSFITEGAIPFAAADPLHVIPCTLVGAGIAGFLSALFKCTLMAPHGGIFVFATVGNPLMYIVSWLIGSAVTCFMLGMIKKDVDKM